MAEIHQIPRTPDRSRRRGRAAAAASAAPDAGRPPRLSLRSGYSLFVTTMKVALPALAAALVLLLVVWPQVAPEGNHFRIGVADLQPEQAKNLSMVNPRFRGRDDKSRPYTVVADVATQESSGADEVDLEQPKADITLNDGAWVALTANQGLYHRERERLHLEGNVSLFHDQGFEMRTSAAEIDLQAGQARSTRPVDGQGPAGTLTAQGFRLLDDGQRIIFTGKSRMVIRESRPEGAE
jgi:lipopolysaccharide export system protein LptC